jgi:hypothetical protein
VGSGLSFWRLIYLPVGLFILGSPMASALAEPLVFEHALSRAGCGTHRLCIPCPEPEGMVCFFTTTPDRTKGRLRVRVVLRRRLYALAPELGLLLDKLKPEIAQRLPHKIIAPIESPRFSWLHPSADQSFGHLKLHLRRCHEITVLLTLTRKRYFGAIFTGQYQLGGPQWGISRGTEMLTTSRRGLILSAAVAGAALGLDKSLAVVAPADSQQTPAPPVRSEHKPPAPGRKAKTPDPKPGFLRYKIGDAECTAIYDGIWEKRHDPTLFSNATVAETKRALTDARLTTAFVTIPITVFVVKLNGKLVLCDAGGGNQAQAFNPDSVFVSGKMMANMRAAGIDPKLRTNCAHRVTAAGRD